jgi:hypothetical protein
MPAEFVRIFIGIFYQYWVGVNSAAVCVGFLIVRARFIAPRVFASAVGRDESRPYGCAMPNSTSQLLFQLIQPIERLARGELVWV